MRLTDCLSIVVAPSVFSAHVRQFSLISLSNYSALIVIVAEDGQVLNRQISFAEEVLPDELASVQNLLNRVFAGKSPREFRAACDVQALEALRDPLAQYVLDEVLACLQESDIGRVRRLGISSLMKKPEFSSSSSLLPLMKALEDESVLDDVFDARDEGVDVVVRIGEENSSEDLSGVSVIASAYGRGDGEGIVAVVGPTRMDYSRVIRAVRAAQHVLRDS